MIPGIFDPTEEKYAATGMRFVLIDVKFAMIARALREKPGLPAVEDDKDFQFRIQPREPIERLPGLVLLYY